MIRNKFMKAFVLGMSITALSSTAAFAATGEAEPAVLRQVQPDAPVAISVMADLGISEDVLNKQREIDRYVFEDHAEEIEAKGFMVSHTGPVGDHVEIGITPFTEENADFLYDTFGRDQVKVVEGMMAVTFDNGNDAVVDAQLFTAEGVEAELFTTQASDAELYATDAVDAELYATDAVDAELYATDAVDAELYATATPVDEAASQSGVVAAGIAGAAVLLGGAVLVKRRQKAGAR